MQTIQDRLHLHRLSLSPRLHHLLYVLRQEWAVCTWILFDTEECFEDHPNSTIISNRQSSMYLQAPSRRCSVFALPRILDLLWAAIYQFERLPYVTGLPVVVAGSCRVMLKKWSPTQMHLGPVEVVNTRHCLWWGWFLSEL